METVPSVSCCVLYISRRRFPESCLEDGTPQDTEERPNLSVQTETPTYVLQPRNPWPSPFPCAVCRTDSDKGASLHVHTHIKVCKTQTKNTHTQTQKRFFLSSTPNFNIDSSFFQTMPGNGMTPKHARSHRSVETRLYETRNLAVPPLHLVARYAGPAV